MNFCFGSKNSASWSFLCLLCMLTTVECWSYYYSNHTMNWTQARSWCREHYTDMVAIQNKEEIEHLNSWLPERKGYYWIGIRKMGDVWTWVGTNKSLTEEATNWARNEPNNGRKRNKERMNEDCVEMYVKRNIEAGKWNDERCSKMKTALCYTAACKNDSCQYGECVETINSHKCECFEGFYGTQCEQVVQCSREEVTVPSKGSVNCAHIHGEFAYGSRCHYSCQQGYRLSSSSPTACTASGKWSEQPPACDLVTCPRVSPPANGTVTCADPLGPSSYQSSCVFSCDVGYTLIGSDSLHCQQSGVWDSSQPLCAAVQCPALQELENGLINCGEDGGREFGDGKTCSFSCATGYQLVGPTTISCTSAAVWNESAPRCAAMKCPVLEAPENGQINCSSSGPAYNPECFFSCDKDYTLHGHEVLTCDDHGNWMGEKPTCQAPQAATSAVASGLAAGGALSLSTLSLAAWILKRLRQKANKFELNSVSDIEPPPQVYRNSIDKLL